MRGIQVADETKRASVTIRRWHQNDGINEFRHYGIKARRCVYMRKLIFSPNKACASRISVYCTRCAMGENLQLLVAWQWNRDYWFAFLAADTSRHNKTCHWLHPINCVFHQLSRISVPFIRLTKLVCHTVVTIPWNNLICFRYLIIK